MGSVILFPDRAQDYDIAWRMLGLAVEVHDQVSTPESLYLLGLAKREHALRLQEVLQ